MLQDTEERKRAFRKSTLSESEIFHLLKVRPQHTETRTEGKKPYIKILAPMVRYSKLPFRLLCKKWGADLTFTPMIIAESFVNSQAARDSDLSTCLEDRPVIAQFATKDPITFARAGQMVADYVQGVDLNCGCPQKWAMQDGIGAALSAQPQLVHDMVFETKKLVPNLPVSIKIRLQTDLRQTVELLRRAENAGVAWVTVHGRTAKGQKDPVNSEAIKFIKSVAKVPIIFNGDVNSWQDMERFIAETGADGVMCARGALSNPAMFSGHEEVPAQCITDYARLALLYGGHFAIHSHHFTYALFCTCLIKDSALLLSLLKLFSLKCTYTGDLVICHGDIVIFYCREMLQGKLTKPEVPAEIHVNSTICLFFTFILICSLFFFLNLFLLVIC